jgi:hypothetical protein
MWRCRARRDRRRVATRPSDEEPTIDKDTDMAHAPSLRRTAATLGVTGLAALLLAAPASARQDPGTGGPDPAPVTRVQFPPHIVNEGLDYFELGLGALGGAGVVAAAAGALTLSHRRHPHPA